MKFCGPRWWANGAQHNASWNGQLLERPSNLTIIVNVKTTNEHSKFAFGAFHIFVCIHSYHIFIGWIIFIFMFDIPKNLWFFRSFFSEGSLHALLIIPSHGHPQLTPGLGAVIGQGSSKTRGALSWDVDARKWREIPDMQGDFPLKEHVKIHGWNTSFLLGWTMFRSELLVSGSCSARLCKNTKGFGGCVIYFDFCDTCKTAQLKGGQGGYIV